MKSNAIYKKLGLSTILVLLIVVLYAFFSFINKGYIREVSFNEEKHNWISYDEFNLITNQYKLEYSKDINIVFLDDVYILKLDDFQIYLGFATFRDSVYGNGSFLNKFIAFGKSLFVTYDANIDLFYDKTLTRDAFLHKVVINSIPKHNFIIKNPNMDFSIIGDDFVQEVHFNKFMDDFILDINSFNLDQIHNAKVESDKIIEYVSEDSIVDAQNKMNHILSNIITLNIPDNIKNKKNLSDIKVSFNDYDFIEFDYENDINIVLKYDNIREYLIKLNDDLEIMPGDVIIDELDSLDINPSFIESIGRFVDGYILNIDKSIENIEIALDNKSYNIDLSFDNKSSSIINNSGHDLGNLELLSTGYSNFQGSPYGRSFNIKKALNERFNNVLIPPGSVFSYNHFLGPVTNSRGWKDSLAIFGGGNLRKVPGGGVCQVSTTIFRAVVKSGLSFVEQWNHSLYVHYYAKYGDGLDSTIFPGVKDLSFFNDTGNYILIQSYNVGDDAIVRFFGTKDDRVVTLDGPYYHDDTIPNDSQFIIDGKVLRYNQILWIQKIEKDNEVFEKNIISTYNKMPRVTERLKEKAVLR